MAKLGTCGALEPRKLRLVTVDIDDAHEDKAKQIFAFIRRTVVNTRRRPDLEKALVLRPISGVEPEMQQIFGAMSAMFCELALAEPHSDKLEAALPVALALYRMRPTTAFYIQCHRAPEGTRTEYHPVSCDGPDTAQAAIEDRPEIKMLRDFQSMQDLLNRGK